MSKQLLTVNAVQRYVRHQRIASIASLPGLDVEAVEYIAHGGSKITQKPLISIRLPRDSIIGAVVHGDSVVIPVEIRSSTPETKPWSSPGTTSTRK